MQREDQQADKLINYLSVILSPVLHVLSKQVGVVDSELCCFCLLQALQVSNHLPVEVRLKSSALLLQATPLLILAQSFLSAL